VTNDLEYLPAALSERCVPVRVAAVLAAGRSVGGTARVLAPLRHPVLASARCALRAVAQPVLSDGEAAATV